MRWSTSTLCVFVLLATSDAQRSGGYCILPGQPIGGSYQLTSWLSGLYNYYPGNRVPDGSFLTYSCDEGYTLKGNRSSSCLVNEWHPPTSCVKSCPMLRSKSVDINCNYGGEPVSCRSTIPPGTKATLTCKPFYEILRADDPGYRELTCLDDGSWDKNLFQCIPECGIPVPHGQALIINGFPAEYPTYPWHVGIYRRTSKAGTFEQICGGTLVSADLVISAAHCFWDETIRTVGNVTKFAVAAGKYYRAYDITLVDPFAQKSPVIQINIATRFFGIGGNYAHDIALLRLKTPFILNTLIRPICMDWDNKHELEQLQTGQSGKVVGWGRTETGLPSIGLREINLPFISYENCIRAVPEEFKGFVTPDKFCAGHLNGTSLCDGDSGGGLFFKFEDLWFLRGIVSTSPITPDHMCDNNYYTAFTNVGMFLGWIRTIHSSTSAAEPGPEPEPELEPEINFTTVAPIGGSTSGCILPEQPANGSFELGSCDGPCDLVPGTKVPIGSSLIYRCNDGYDVEGNNVTLCRDNVWNLPPICLKKGSIRYCPALRSRSVDFVCNDHNDEIVSCESPIAPGTKATLVCKNFYQIPAAYNPGYSEITCLEDGTWDRTAFQCIPECGVAVPEGTQLIVNGSTIKYERFPWTVFIYFKHEAGFSRQQYTGTLISPDLVISRAEWFYNEMTRSVANITWAVAVGTYNRSYYTLEPYAQKSLVKSIHLAKGYLGSYGHDYHNIALLRLMSPLTMATLVRPICLNWEDNYPGTVLDGEKKDKAVESRNSTTSVLNLEGQETLPYTPYEECVSQTATREKNFLTADMFCVDYENRLILSNSSLCGIHVDGNSFDCQFHGRWYLLGVRSGPVHVSRNSYEALQVYTKVGSYLSWIRAAYISEE